MYEIDAITNMLASIFKRSKTFSNLVSIIKDLGESAKLATETQRSDASIIEIWPRFVGTSDRIFSTKLTLPKDSDRKQQALGKRGMQLIKDGADLIISHSNNRMPMPKSTTEFLERCAAFKEKYGAQIPGN